MGQTFAAEVLKKIMISQEESEKNIDWHIEQTQNERKNKRLFRRYLVFFAFIFALPLSFWLGFDSGKKSGEEGLATFRFPIDQTKVINKDGSVLDFSLFWKTWDLLKEKYVDSSSLDSRDLLYGAIKGMLAATGDSYNTFFNPEENKRFNQEISQSFEGIGVEIGVKNNILTVIAPLTDSPAEKAGIRAGDKIFKIGDKTTTDLGTDEAVNLIRGPKGTEVKLTILHEKDENTSEIAVKREIIKIKSIKFEIKDDSIGYLKLSQFGEETLREFAAAQREIIAKNPKALILDLRNNPGGYLDGSVNIASKMIPKGKVVVIEEDQNKNRKSILTRGGDMLSHIKTIVLINEGSASAAEILAGALRDNRENVVLVGMPSFGKGSVQEMIDLPEETAVKITIAKWLTPKGEQINEKGINPDVKIDLTIDDYRNNKDPQLDKALEILNQNQ